MAGINVLVCGASNLPNTGSKNMCFEELKSINNVILMPRGYEFATITDALTESNWQDQLESLSDRFYKLIESYMIEDQSEEPAVESTVIRGDFQVNDGKIKIRYFMVANKQFKNNMNQFAAKEWDFALIDEDGKILVSTPDNTKITGIPGKLTVGMDRIAQDGSLKGDVFYIDITITDTLAWKERGVVLQPLNESSPWNPKTDLISLEDVTLTEGSGTLATLIVVTVQTKYSSVPISGLGTATANWVYTGSGSLNSVVDNGDGTYNLVGTGFANSDTVNLAAASVLSLDGYESDGAITIANI